jgi:hypothetical protein
VVCKSGVVDKIKLHVETQMVKKTRIDINRPRIDLSGSSKTKKMRSSKDNLISIGLSSHKEQNSNQPTFPFIFVSYS